jgi:hypothetical protein
LTTFSDIEREEKTMQKWEYRIEPITDAVYATKTLNTLGDDGWELVTIVESAYYFKREKVEIDKPKMPKPYPPREPQRGHPVG